MGEDYQFPRRASDRKRLKREVRLPTEDEFCTYKNDDLSTETERAQCGERIRTAAVLKAELTDPIGFSRCPTKPYTRHRQSTCASLLSIHPYLIPSLLPGQIGRGESEEKNSYHHGQNIITVMVRELWRL
jgi:hypothetical protein